jgi:hypothetical protein
LNSAQYTLPTAILNHILDSFQITHSYFSSPVTCPTNIHKFYSPFTRDKIFGSLGTLFQYQWQGLGYAHPHNAQDAQQVLHWAQLAASTDPDNITIIALPDKKWYKNITPLLRPFPDTHVITYFPPDTLIYEEPITPALPITYRALNRNCYAVHLLCTLQKLPYSHPLKQPYLSPTLTTTKYPTHSTPICTSNTSSTPNQQL